MKAVYSVLISCILLMGILHGGAIAYTPTPQDRTLAQHIATKIDQISSTGGKERLVGLISQITLAKETASYDYSHFMLSYIQEYIAFVLEEQYDVSVDIGSENMVALGILTGEIKKDIVTIIKEQNQGIPVHTSTSLSGFYDEYKGYVTSTAPILDRCTKYYDQIDAIAREHNFPTALIVATRYREHTCHFDNPANGRGNFQITSHYYPAGEISRDDFKNQIINFIAFSKAKRAYYDKVQSFGKDPIDLSYDHIDLTSLRKHAIFYNGVSSTLEENVYANQNFGSVSSGRDGIVAMTLRALGRQLYKEKDLGPRKEIVEDIQELEEDIEDKEEVVEEDIEEEASPSESTEEESEECEPPFSINLGSGATHPQVATIQQFLKDQGFSSEKPSGIYDEKTTEAVNAFQAYYKADILDPGGYKAPTGYRYPATRRKANSIVCE